MDNICELSDKIKDLKITKQEFEFEFLSRNVEPFVFVLKKDLDRSELCEFSVKVKNIKIGDIELYVTKKEASLEKYEDNACGIGYSITLKNEEAEKECLYYIREEEWKNINILDKFKVVSLKQGIDLVSVKISAL